MILRHGSLESGQGGFDLAAEWMGWENVFHVEINPFCQTILKHYWPKSKSYADIFQFSGTEWRGKVDIITGGFPCQPFSNAGKREGSEDTRHLWPENLRIVKEAQPAVCVFENVPGLLTIERGMVFETVCSDLEAEGYEVTPLIIPACATGKVHRRDRIWFVAYSDSLLSALSVQQRRQDSASHPNINRKIGIPDPDCHSGQRERKEGEIRPRGDAFDDIPEQFNAADNSGSGLERVGGSIIQKQHVGSPDKNFHAPNAENQRLQRSLEADGGKGQKPDDQLPDGRRREWNIGTDENWFEAATRLCSMDDGIPGGLDAQAIFNQPCKPKGAITRSKWRAESIKSHGNAIVPDVAFEIFKAIQSTLTCLSEK